MLPEDFPRWQGFELYTEGPNEYIIIMYDTDRDEEVDLRVHYFIKFYPDKTTIINSGPYKVERLSMKYILVERRVSTKMDNRVEFVEKLKNGVWTIKQYED